MKLRIKKLLKLFWNYTIQDDVRIYSLKHTPIKIKRSLVQKAEKELGKYPIQKNKIVFDNYMGKGYGGNCKYVTEELLKRNTDVEIVWIVKDIERHRQEFPPQVRLVEYKSKEALKEYYTAGFWICNYHLIAYFNMGLTKQEGQCYIQMWHGSLGIKRIEKDCGCLTASKSWEYLAQKNSRNTDYWISNSSFETGIYQRAFWSVRRVLEYGHPRNDLFFQEDSLSIEQKVKAALGIAKDEQIVLYVPTFRENGSFPENRLNIEELIEGLQERFSGKWRVAVRLHPRMERRIWQVCMGEQESIVVADEYPDIQELLYAAKVVITDYSSCIFDFLFTKRPGFIYAPDIAAYNNERGFYYRLEDTPFSIASDNRQLAENIRSFDEECYKQRISEFMKEKGCIEDGHAAERVSSLVEKILLEKES